MIGLNQQLGTADVYTINSDGTEVTNITNTPEIESDPEWHPLF